MLRQEVARWNERWVVRIEQVHEERERFAAVTVEPIQRQVDRHVTRTLRGVLEASDAVLGLGRLHVVFERLEATVEAVLTIHRLRADEPGRLPTGRSKRLEQARALTRQSFLPDDEEAPNAVLVGPRARQERTGGDRGQARLRVDGGEAHSARRQGVDRRRGVALFVTEAAQVIRARRVEHDEQQVGSRGARPSTGRQAQGEGERGFESTEEHCGGV